jgi:signal recognition particle subunit SEC65
VEEILRQRAGRQMREEMPPEKIELGSFDDTNKKLLMEIKDSQDSVQPNEMRLRESLRSSTDKQGEIHISHHNVEAIS